MKYVAWITVTKQDQIYATKLFNAFDGDHNGFIVMTEFAEGVNKLRKDLKSPDLPC